MASNKPVIHGRDHGAGGADPIPPQASPNEIPVLTATLFSGFTVGAGVTSTIPFDGNSYGNYVGNSTAAAPALDDDPAGKGVKIAPKNGTWIARLKVVTSADVHIRIGPAIVWRDVSNADLTMERGVWNPSLLTGDSSTPNTTGVFAEDLFVHNFVDNDYTVATYMAIVGRVHNLGVGDVTVTAAYLTVTWLGVSGGGIYNGSDIS